MYDTKIAEWKSFIVFLKKKIPKQWYYMKAKCPVTAKQDQWIRMFHIREIINKHKNNEVKTNKNTNQNRFLTFMNNVSDKSVANCFI